MILPKNLPAGKKPIVLVTYDELTFDSNDVRGYVWMKYGEPPICKKTHGKRIIVSHFVIPRGYLRASESLLINTLPALGLTVEDNHQYSPYTTNMRIEYGGDSW
ncbi:hypothetical protein HOY80DRAFT_879271 [Tuber brumale]|nr:hypothetical protein HOY80DRAFT_879271 [Tuber brumale]